MSEPEGLEVDLITDAPLSKPTEQHDCEVCHAEPSVGVAAIPGVPMSCAYGAKCLAANAHPYEIVMVNTALVGGYDRAADWWKEIVDDTLTHLGKSRAEFDAAVAAEITAQKEDERRYFEEQERRIAAEEERINSLPGERDGDEL